MAGKPTDAPLELAQEGKRFIERCSKPNKEEYLSILRAVGTGFLMMGALGFVVKLVHIPIRHLITV